MKRAFPIAALLTVLLLIYALYQALVVAPTDQIQGNVYRIIYYHVPSAWTAFVFFTVNFVASVTCFVSVAASEQMRWLCRLLKSAWFSAR